MSILTKISVVVLLIMILLAVPVFITQATIGPNWRHAYEQEHKRSEGYEMDTRSEMLAHGKTIIERDVATDSLQRIRSEKQMEIDRMVSQLTDSQAKTAGLRNDLNRLATEVAGLRAEAETFNKRNAMLATELEKGRTEITDLNKDLIRTNDLLKQSEAEKDRLEKQARVGEEKIRDLEEETEQLRQAGAIAKRPRGEEITPVPDQPITGTITAVTGDYASINIGSAKGIKKNMRLIVHRGAQFVARLRVDEVESTQAAGIIIDRRIDPIQGDKVTTDLIR